MSELKLTKTRFTGGIWEGVVTGGAGPLEVVLDAEPVQGVALEALPEGGRRDRRWHPLFRDPQPRGWRGSGPVRGDRRRARRRGPGLRGRAPAGRAGPAETRLPPALQRDGVNPGLHLSGNTPAGGLVRTGLDARSARPPPRRPPDGATPCGIAGFCHARAPLPRFPAFTNPRHYPDIVGALPRSCPIWKRYILLNEQ